MRILYVCTDFNRSGAALAMIELAEKVYQLGHEVILLYPGYGDAVDEAKKRGLNYRVIRSYEWVKPLNRKEKISEKVKWYLKHIYNLISIRQIENLIKKENVDIVHNNTLWGYVGPAAARRMKIPYVWHMRELLEQQQKQLRWKQYGEELINHADALIAISRLVQDNYAGRFPKEKMHLIYDGVDVSKMYQKDHKLFQSDKTKIIIIGGIRESKRQIDVVKATEILLNRGLHVELSIVGADDSAYANSIKKYIEAHELGNSIKCYAETSDVASFWIQNDISVTASQFEAFGRVTAEAMLTGCVVVVSNSGANEEIVSDCKTGYVYEVANPESLAETIERVIKEKEKAKKCAIAGRDSVVRRFSSEKNAENILELYKAVLKI